MNKSRIKRSTAIILIIFIVFVFCLSIFFGVTGNTAAFLAMSAFNTLFIVMLYFMLRLHRYAKGTSKSMNELDDDNERNFKDDESDK